MVVESLVFRIGSDVSIESVEAGCIVVRMQHYFRDGTLYALHNQEVEYVL